MRSTLQPVPAVLALTLLAGCAGSQPSTGTGAAATAAPTGTPAQQAALARYSAYAGPPIKSFTWLGRFYSWEGLGKDKLVVFTTTNDAYLLTIWPPCDLRFTVHTIGVTSTGATIYSGLDSVVADGRRCPIGDIRRIDYAKMKADARAAPAAGGTPAGGAPPTDAAPADDAAPPK